MSDKKSRYKYCIVPGCRSTTVRTPQKIFISVPTDPKIRKKWIVAMKRDNKKNVLSMTSNRFCCEDHFELEKDMDNFMKWKMMGGSIRIKREVVPHIFECQRPTVTECQKTSPTVLRKGTRKQIVEETPEEVEKMSIENVISEACTSKSTKITVKSETQTREDSCNNIETVWLKSSEEKSLKQNFPNNANVLQINIKEEPTDDNSINQTNEHQDPDCATKTIDSSYIKQEYSDTDLNLATDPSDNANLIDIEDHVIIKQEHRDEDLRTDDNFSNDAFSQSKPQQYQCEVCNKRFVQMRHLTNHRRLHTGWKPYKCDVCDKRFSQLIHLKTHKFVHTIEKPFKKLSNLKEHRQLRNGDKPNECSPYTSNLNNIESVPMDAEEPDFRHFLFKEGEDSSSSNTIRPSQAYLESELAPNDTETDSDNNDPSYTPEGKLVFGEKRNIPDFSQEMEQIKKEQIKKAKLSKPPSGDSDCSVSMLSNDPRIQSCPYLDGAFFKVVDIKESEKLISTQCQLCLPNRVFIKGCIGVSTNFLKHLGKIHGEKALTLYKSHKKNKAQERRSKKVITDEDTGKVEIYSQNKITDCSGKTENKTQERKSKKVFIDEVEKEILHSQNEIMDCSGKRGNISQEEFDSRILNFIVSTSAISLVDNTSFIKLFDGMNLNVMNQKTAMCQIRTKCEDISSKIRRELDHVKYVVTTVDLWSAKRRSFFGVTCHWLGDNLQRHSVALACKRLPNNLTSDKIKEILKDIHTTYNLDDAKIIATVTDNGANFESRILTRSATDISRVAVQDIDTDSDEDNCEEQDDVLFTSIVQSGNYVLHGIQNDEEKVILSLHKHIRCVSQTLGLLATADTNEVIQKDQSLSTINKNAMQKCSLLWKMAKKPKSAEIIQSTLNQALSYPVVTGWDSLYDSISKIVKDKDKLPDLFDKLNLKNICLEEKEINYLIEYCEIFKPLAQATDMLQEQNNTYFGYVLPCLGSLLKKFDRLKGAQLTYARPILEACRSGLYNRFEAYFTLTSEEAKDAIIASVTIPAFKMRWINIFKETSKIDLFKEIPTILIDALKKECGNIEKETESLKDTSLSQLENSFFEFEDVNFSTSSSVSSSSAIQNKMEIEALQYLSDEATDLRSIHKFPNVKKLFLKYNTILPSSAPVEKLFPFAEIVNDPQRHALSDKNFELLVLLKANEFFLK